MSRLFLLSVIALLLVMLNSCSKENGPLSLNEQYLFVTDVVEYCQGTCDETAFWEQQTVLAKGYAKDLGNASAWDQNHQNKRFYMLDIRTGYQLEVRVTGDEDLIFSRLANVKKTDVLFIQATAYAVVAQDNAQCTKGVVLLVDNSIDIQINLE